MGRLRSAGRDGAGGGHPPVPARRRLRAAAVGHVHPLLPARRQGSRRQPARRARRLGALQPAATRPTCASCTCRTSSCCRRRAARCSPTGCASRRSSWRSSTCSRCSSAAWCTLPLPDQPGKYFGVQLNLAAEMEYFSPDDRLSLQRILFYGRGGFDVIDPRHFPYRQPDFRDPAVIQATGNTPVPFMLLLRRMGRERQARLPIDEARAVMRLLYDEFACFCTPEFLQNSLDIVLQRLDGAARQGQDRRGAAAAADRRRRTCTASSACSATTSTGATTPTRRAPRPTWRACAPLLARQSALVRRRGRVARRRAGADAALRLRHRATSATRSMRFRRWRPRPTSAARAERLAAAALLRKAARSGGGERGARSGAQERRG